MVDDDWMMTITDNAIKRILKKILKMATQTNGWFFPLGRGMRTCQNPSFSTTEEVGELNKSYKYKSFYNLTKFQKT